MKRSFFSNLVLSALCLVTFGILPSLAQEDPVRLQVQGDNVNLRSQPDVEKGKVVGQADFHEILQLVSYRGDWAQVRLPGEVKAYVHSDFLHNGNIVKPRSLRVRGGPGTDFPILSELARGDKVEVISDDSANKPWVQIRSGQPMTGWIFKEYVEELPPEPKPEPPAPETAEAEGPKKPQRPPVIPPPGVKIDPDKPQGIRMKSEGMVKFHPQIGYYLSNARGGVLCTLRVPEPEIRRYNGKQVYLEGQSFWMPGVSAPLIVPSRISEVVVFRR